MGRTQLPEHERKKNRCIRLTDESWEFLREYGDGSVTSGIEDLIYQAANNIQGEEDED